MVFSSHHVKQPIALLLYFSLLINGAMALPEKATRPPLATPEREARADIGAAKPEQPPVSSGPLRLKEAFGKLPLSFAANAGQIDAAVKFTARSNGMSLFLLDSEVVFAVPNAEARTLIRARSHAATDALINVRASAFQVRMKLSGANTKPEIAGVDALPGKANYFLGNDPAKWRTDVPTFGKVRYADVYPGVDLIFYGNQQQLEYDFAVAPHADPAKIALNFAGADKLAMNRQGDLVIKTAGGELRMRAPVAYQETNGVRQTVRSRYTLRGRQVGFQLGKYDRARPLVIDPVIVYSTYLGGIGTDFGFGIAVDGSGNAYVTGNTNFTDFPTANPFQATFGGTQDAFVTKFSVAGNTLIYSTYLGGNGSEDGRSIAVDATGNAYLTGDTSSANFPTMNPFQPAISGSDAFVTKINAAGNALIYSTYLGGNSQDKGFGIAVDAAGSAYVTGRANSRNFPTANPFQAAHGGGDFDAFVTKFNPAGTALVYSGYLGGGGNDEGYGIALDASGNAYVTGRVFSANFPTVNAFQSSRGDSGFGDAFVTKINAAGNTLAYSTFLGGSRTEEGQGVAVDASGNAYVTGYTGSLNFPTANAFQPANGNPNLFNDADAFVTKLSAAGNTLVYSTYLGGSDRDVGVGLAVDSSGSAFVTGRTLSTNFPLQDALTGTGAGNLRSAFATKFNTNGQTLSYSSYLGAPNGTSEGYGIALDTTGAAYVTGTVQSAGFPTVNAFQANFAGNVDAFVMKIGATIVPPGENLSITPNRGGDTGAVSVTLSFANSATFPNGATLKLARTGQPDIVARRVSIGMQGRMMGGVFDLRGGARGLWDVVVTNPDNTSIRLANGFTIEAGREPDVLVEINGRDTIRQSRRQTYTVTITNRGNIDAYSVPVSLSFPNYLTFRPDFNVINPPQPPDLPPIDFSQVPLTNTDGNKTLVPLDIPILRPDVPHYIRFSLEAPPTPELLNTEFQVEARADEPILELAPATLGPLAPRGDIPPYRFNLSNACIRSIIDVIFGIIGVAIPLNCAQAVVAQILNAHIGIAVAVAGDLANGGGDNSLSSINGLTLPGAIQLLSCLPGVGIVFNALALALAIVNALNDCFKQEMRPVRQKTVRIIGSHDPNDKVGAQGVTAARFVTGERLPYTVYFENVATATAPAQDVVITDQLDPAKFDFTTFALGPIAFGNRRVTPPPNAKTFRADVDLRPAMPLLVRIDAGLDTATGLLRWTFTSLDPVTMQPPEDPNLGFLPPNVNPPEGDGNVTFSVKPRVELATGTQVRNRASIVFDTNPPIVTPEWLNTIDNSAPASSVVPLAAQAATHSFPVTWSGLDTGSGIGGYTVFVSENGGPFNAWLTNTAATSAIFYGGDNKTYAFYTTARDRAGNLEAAPDAPDSVTTTPAGNPIEEARWFVRQHYLDFLAREPDVGGLDYWTGQITSCGANAACISSRRIGVSAAFFVELEYQESAAYVYRLYKAAYGEEPLYRPPYAQFFPDRARVVGGATLEQGKLDFANLFATRPDFLMRYPSTQTPVQFVDAILLTVQQGANVSFTGPQRDAFSNDVNTGGRGLMLKNLGDNAAFKQAVFNRAFVLAQYFGYLRRDPDQAGYEFWLDILNQQSNNFRGMVCAFITSAEYQLRFSPATPRSNAECAGSP